MTITLFTDLDETLFSTSRKEVDYPATVDLNGNYHSYTDRNQNTLIELFKSINANFIPVTGRNSESLDRCIIDCIGRSEYSIVSHGMMILDQDKKANLSWIKYLKENFDLEYWQLYIKKTECAIRENLDEYRDVIKVKIVKEQGYNSYISIKVRRGFESGEVLKRLKKHLDGNYSNTYKVHQNGRDYALLPPYCSKSNAVSYVSKLMGLGDNDTVFGIGDSITDLEFMLNADFLIIPNNSQLARSIDE